MNIPGSDAKFVERENAQGSIRLLAAANTFYGRARTVRAVQVFAIVLIPCALSVAAAFDHTVDLTAAFVGFLLSLIDASILYPIVKVAQRRGAQIQERFDSQVLGLPLLPSRVDGGPDSESIDAAARHTLRKAKAGEGYRNWYAPALGRLRPPLDRLGCQRTNSVWDDGLRAWFQWILFVALVVVSSIIFGIDIYLTRPGGWLITALFFPLLPAYLWTIREVQDQREARGSRRDLRRLTCRLWDGFLDGRLSVDDVIRGSEDLQAAIFVSRATAPPVPQLLYKVLRNRFESEMVESAMILVEDVETRRPELLVS
jgi:hypothetical protein